MLIILCSTCENYVSGFTSTSTTSIRILPSIIKQINQQKQQQGRAHFYNSDNFLSSTRKRQTTRIYATNTNKDNDNFNDDETSREKNTQILNIDKLTNKADSLLDDKSSSEEAISTTTTTTSTSTKIENRRQGNVVVDVVDQEEEESPMNRRIFFGSALVGTSALVAGVTATQSMVNAQQQQQQASIWSA
ncbi:MAG: hypothetical protein ACI90V_013721, partial [Bacillariaceae sp.]